MLEKAGVIIRSISPWASPIVIVPKKTAPGEPPRHCMCVDYHVLNSLLPCVDAGSQVTMQLSATHTP